MAILAASGSAVFMKAAGYLGQVQAATLMSVSLLPVNTEVDLHKDVTIPLTHSVLSPSDSFSKNPQYRIEVPDLGNWKEGEKNILISLMQKPKVSNRKSNQSYPIGMTVFKVCCLRLVLFSV